MSELATLKDWKFSIDQEGIAWAVFDREGESANSLGRRPIEELGQIIAYIEKVAADKKVVGLALMSGKEKGYIVGADIREFDQLDTEAKVIEGIAFILAWRGLYNWATGEYRFFNDIICEFKNSVFFV